MRQRTLQFSGLAACPALPATFATRLYRSFFDHPDSSCHPGGCDRRPTGRTGGLAAVTGAQLARAGVPRRCDRRPVGPSRGASPRTATARGLPRPAGAQWCRTHASPVGHWCGVQDRDGQPCLRSFAAGIRAGQPIAMTSGKSAMRVSSPMVGKIRLRGHARPVRPPLRRRCAR